MSLILDAMKKLDRERSAGSAGKRDINTEILKSDDSPRRRSLLPLAVALGVTACVAALVTFLFIGGTGPQKDSTPATNPAALSRHTASTPPPSVPAAVAGKTVPNHAASPGTTPEASAPTKQRMRAKKDGEPSAGGRIPGRSGDAGKPTTGSEAGAAPRPAVKISGIVWQEEPSERKVMINGKVARVGDVVDGMRILEIHPSHVKFSFNGKSFKAGMFE